MTYTEIASKKWKKAVWVTGHGPYALLAHCRDLTITLHSTIEKAEDSKKWIDRYGCGGACYKRHEIIDLRPFKK